MNWIDRTLGLKIQSLQTEMMDLIDFYKKIGEYDKARALTEKIDKFNTNGAFNDAPDGVDISKINLN